MDGKMVRENQKNKICLKKLNLSSFTVLPVNRSVGAGPGGLLWGSGPGAVRRTLWPAQALFPPSLF